MFCFYYRVLASNSFYILSLPSLLSIFFQQLDLSRNHGCS